MRLMVLATVLALAACSHTTPPPAIQVRTVRETVEVQRPCPVTVPQRPAALALPLPGDANAALAVVGDKLREWSGAGGFGDRAEAALRKCVAR